MAKPPQTSQADSSIGLYRRRIIYLLTLIFIGMAVFRGGSLWWRHDDIIVGGQQQAHKLSHVLGEHLQQTFATIDATFATLVAHSTRVGGPEASSDSWSRVLETALSGLNAVDRISVLDRAGRIRHATSPATIGEIRSDHPAFRTLSETMDIGTITQGTFLDPSTGRLMLPVVRALTSATNEFDGVVAALFDARLLRPFYQELDLGPESVIAIFSVEGELLYRQGPGGGLASLAEAIKSVRASGDIWFEEPIISLRAPIGLSDDRYVASIRSIPRAPIYVTVSLSETELLKAWRDEVILSLAVMIMVGLLLLIGGVLMSRELRMRAAIDATLRRNEEHFHEIMYRAPLFVCIKDASGRVKFLNKVFEDLLGVTQAEVLGKTFGEIPSTSPMPVSIITELDREVVESRKAIQREETYSSRYGSKTAMFVKFPLFDEQGNVDSIASFSLDLTEHRRALQWLNALMDHTPASVAVNDAEGRFVFVNRALAEAVGIKEHEFLGKTLHELFPPDYADAHERFDREVVEVGEPITREFVAPYAGGNRTFLFVKFPLRNAQGRIDFVASIATDVTDRKQAEKQMAHAQRMEAVGQLTGGIAHDFNNLLTVMIGNSEILAAELTDNERLLPLAQMTLEAAERSAALTQRLLAFGRRQMLEPKPTDVFELVEEMEPLLKRAAGAQAQLIVRRMDDELWHALVDLAQLETAILNLVVNSRDAMPDGGRIVIEIANSQIDADYVELNPDAKPGQYVMVAVSDTGTGMPPEVVARVFEPFFTTKEQGKGTGLGLPTIYGFMKQSGGHIKISSEVGQGTEVRLYLPRANCTSIVPALNADTEAELPRGKESILLVEDDRIVRAYTEAQLLELGYRVTIATGPDDALRLARLTGKPDLLLTDIVMEGSMNGRQLAERLRERWPDLKVLCMSGYTDGVLPTDAVDMPDGMHFLAKPFRRRDLALKVREAIDMRTSEGALA